MPTGHVFIATSIDGYIARDNGELDWLELPNSAGEDHGYDDFISGIDAIVMGRGTYQKVKSFGQWPYRVPVHVMSSSLASDSSAPSVNITFGQGTPKETMETCQKNGWKRIYIDGGKIIQAFLRAGLVDDLILSRIPVLLGEGKPLFGALENDIRLKHIWSRDFPSGLTQSSYQVIK